MSPERTGRPALSSLSNLAVGVVALSLLVIGTGSATASPRGWVDMTQARQASAFAVKIVSLIAKNRYADAWVELHPLHQQVAPLERYVECELLTPVPVQPAAIRALRARTGLADIAGFETRVPAMNVAIRIVMADATSNARVAFTKTVAVVRAGGRWSWFLPRPRYAAYARGDCPQ